VSESELPKIVILGTGKSRNSQQINSIMSTVEPTLIPTALVEGMYITFRDDSKVKVEKRHLGNGIDYTDIQRTLQKIGIDGNIRLVEIVVDLDLAHSLLRERSDLILGPLFDE